MLLDLPFLFKLQDEFKYGRLPPGVVVNYLGLDYCNALQFSVRLGKLRALAHESRSTTLISRIL